VPLLQTLPRIGGIGETVKRLHGEGIAVLLNTIGWSFIAEEFQREFGFDAVSGVVAGEDPAGVFNGIIDRHFDEHDKVTFAEAHVGGKGITMAEVAAVGDSKSDIPLFEKVGLAIALNATPAAREAAHVHFESDDLTVVLEPILSRNGDTP
jgi:phosphoserine phosphatase